MNKSLDLIENYTRYVKIWTGEQSQNMLWCLQTMTERSGYIVASLDAIGGFASQQLAWLQRIGIAIETQTSAAIVNNVSGGAVMNVYNPTFNNGVDMDSFFDSFNRSLREAGQSI